MDTLDIFENSTDDVDQFEDDLTAAEVLQKLEDAWLNEKHSPELLEPKMEIVECMLEQVCFNTFDKIIKPKHNAGEYNGREFSQVEERGSKDPRA